MAKQFLAWPFLKASALVSEGLLDHYAAGGGGAAGRAIQQIIQARRKRQRKRALEGGARLRELLLPHHAP